jgi:RNA polymerase sigma factor FliA
MPLVFMAAKRAIRHLPSSVQFDDLVAAGTIGLLDAMRRSPNRGSSFSAYARVRIRGAILDELRSQDWLSRRARKRLPDTVFLELFDHAVEDSPQERAVLRASIARAIVKLPLREAEIVSGYYIEGVSFSEIAKRLKISQARVSQLHSQAMDRLRAELAREDR